MRLKLKSEMREEITTTTTEIQAIIRQYYEKLYAKKLNNLEEMYTFLETYDTPKLSQKEIDNWHRLITSYETESVY